MYEKRKIAGLKNGKVKKNQPFVSHAGSTIVGVSEGVQTEIETETDDGSTEEE